MRFVTIDGQVRGRAKASASGFGVLPPIQQGVVPENEMSKIKGDLVRFLKNLANEAFSPQARTQPSWLLGSPCAIQNCNCSLQGSLSLPAS